jgi:formylglycine-generating enzyme required for sulfatase activity
MPKVTIQHQTAQAFTEDLGDGTGMTLVLIPAGRFTMGSPEEEPERRKSEGPQHAVSVPGFFMGQYPVTQAQWRAVCQLPPVKRELKPEPSRFKGDRRPVEQVSWYDAVEFCQRLSRHTRRDYRLPSEAEWEYACRAGTTTPFHFGETLTTDLANYRGTDDETLNWSGSYGRGPKGIYRQETTDVGWFEVTNAFGLYDMHGNVWEWCADYWHENYQGAPTDGSAWLKGGDEKWRVLRGGSWNYGPRYCRSANRDWDNPDFTDYTYGFRVICSAPGTR